uniref:Pentatricopeptide repeat-containing protein n=1 Tax=Aegilops tauschii TaxID=37682 RepID=R7W6I4_AEGTA
MDVAPNEGTLASALVACGRLGAVRAGKAVHGWCLKRQRELELIVGNALLDMYVKCEKLHLARRVFDRLLVRDIVSWTVMISGLVHCRLPSEALELFNGMQTSGVKPDKVVLSTVLSACASLGALESGRWVHEYIERKGIEWDVHVGTSLVDMYAKCGCLETSLSIFHKMPVKNVSSWNALINGFALHGHGLVQEGLGLFNLMNNSYNLSPREEHYGCMVDLLGRAGLIQEAYGLIKVMPMTPAVSTWGALLSACQAHGRVEFSQQILRHVHELESSGSGFYVLLSNLYALNDRWTDVKRVRGLLSEKGLWKEPGSSLIEVNELLDGGVDSDPYKVLAQSQTNL